MPNELSQTAKQEKLVAALKAIEADERFPERKSFFEEDYEDPEMSATVDNLIALANNTLVNENGEVRLRCHKFIENKGFPVTQGGLSDSVWITGVINTSKGRFVYG